MKIELAALSKGLLAGFVQYTLPKPAWWYLTTTNWNLVCNGGLLVGALAFASAPVAINVTNHTSTNASALSDAVFKFASSGLPIAFGAYGPSGAWSEGTTYWGYGTKYALAAVGSVRSTLGIAKAKTFYDVPGFHKTGLFR